MSQQHPAVLTWVNAEQTSSCPVADRGLAYGDGVFETMRYCGNRIALLERHLRRLDSSCRRLMIALDLPQIEREIAAFLEVATQCSGAGVIKLIVTRGANGRGYRTAPEAVPTRILQQFGLPEYPPDWQQGGVELRYCDTRLGLNTTLAGIKHLNRLEQVLARLEWADENIAEGLMSDPRGRIVEGISTNVFLVSGGRLLTPMIEHCGVAGVMREFILEDAARTLGISAATASCERALLAGAQELFVCNAVVGIWPVRKLGTKIYTVGAVTRRIQDHVAKFFAA